MTQKTSGGEPTFEVDSPEQYDLIPNDTYFKDNFLGIKLYKTTTGSIVNPWLAGIAQVYKANLSQVETEAPTAQVGINSLGGTGETTLIYDSPGKYYLRKTGAFIGVIIVGASQVNAPDIVVNITKEDDDNLLIRTSSEGVYTDELLSETSISIEVYPDAEE